MSDLNKVFADNLIFLRKHAKLTQLELAEKLNYSDKAVSKWERGEAIPDISVLLNIAEIFGITVDELMKEHKDGEKIGVSEDKRANIGLSVSLITFLGLIVCQTIVMLSLSSVVPTINLIQYCFLYPLPIYAVLGLIFTAIWGKPSYLIIPVGVLVFFVTLDAFLLVFHLTGTYNFWIFTTLVPTELIVILSFRLNKNTIKVKKKDGKE